MKGNNKQKMDKFKITERMQKLSQGSENRPAISLIKDIFDDIEIALNKKVKQEAIWEDLKKEGYLIRANGKVIPLKTFLSAITRIKKGMSKQQKNSVAKPTTFGTQAATTESSINPLRALSGNPQEGEFNPIPMAKIEIDNS